MKIVIEAYRCHLVTSFLGIDPGCAQVDFVDVTAQVVKSSVLNHRSCAKK